MSEIKLSADGKLRCMFNPTDTIFFLDQRSEDYPNDSEIKIYIKIREQQGGLMCNACGVKIPIAKKLFKTTEIRFCEFCAEGNCLPCMQKSRPYPRMNPDKLRRGMICTQCDKKFLYRDALHENQIKLSMRDTGAVENFDALVDYERKYE